MRLFAAAVLAALLLLAACGDDDSDPTPTATPEPTASEPIVSPGQLTPNPDACTADIMEGRLVGTEGAAGHVILTLEAENTERACTLEGPPELRWFDAAGTGLGVTYIAADDCESDETDYSVCIYPDAVGLDDPDANLPIGAIEKVRAVVSVTNVGAVPTPCASPLVQAAAVGLQFPGVPLDVRIPLDEPIQLQTCFNQVDMLGYGPVLSGED